MLGDSYLMIGQAREEQDCVEKPQSQSGKRLNGQTVPRRRANRLIDLFIRERVQNRMTKRYP